MTDQTPATAADTDKDASFDISALDTGTGADKGAKMEVIDTRTGNPARHSNGDPVTITLLGMQSKKAQDHLRSSTNRRLERQNRSGRNTGMKAEDIEEQTVELMTLLTIGWSFTVMDGEPFPCTPQNARKFWADRRFAEIRRQADSFVANSANFVTQSGT